MAGKRYDVLVPREYESNGQKKTAFTRIGVAFPLKEKKGLSVQLDAHPMGDRLVIVEHQDKPKDAPEEGL